MGAALNGPIVACSEVSTAAGCSWVRALHHLLGTELPWSCFPAAELLRLIQISQGKKEKKNTTSSQACWYFFPQTLPMPQELRSRAVIFQWLCDAG